MPIELVLFLIIIFAVISVGLWVHSDQKICLIFAIIIPSIAIGATSWLIIAKQKDFSRSEEISEIRTITVDEYNTYQIVMFSDGEVINITDKFKRIYPDGTKVKQLKPTSGWICGIYYNKNMQKNKYEIVKE